MTGGHDPSKPDPLEAALLRRTGAKRPMAGLGRLLAWTGRLGWTLVTPIVAGALVGHLIDRAVGHGVTFAAGLILLGAMVGFRVMWLELNREDRE